MEVFTATFRQAAPIQVSGTSSRQYKGCRQLSKVNGAAVNQYIRLALYNTFDLENLDIRHCAALLNQLNQIKLAIRPVFCWRR